MLVIGITLCYYRLDDINTNLHEIICSHEWTRGSLFHVKCGPIPSACT